MTMRFDPELTKRIMKYKDAKWFQGSRSLGQIRWMIHDENRNPVSCDQCGNIANGVLMERAERYMLKIPMCRGHLQAWMKDHPDYEWNENYLVLWVPMAADKIKKISDSIIGKRSMATI